MYRMCAQLLRFQNYTRWVLHATKVKKKAAPAAKSEAEMDALAKSIDASMTMSKLTDAQRDIVKAKMFLGFRMGGGAYAYITT